MSRDIKELKIAHFLINFQTYWTQSFIIIFTAVRLSLDCAINKGNLANSSTLNCFKFCFIFYPSIYTLFLSVSCSWQGFPLLYSTVTSLPTITVQHGPNIISTISIVLGKSKRNWMYLNKAGHIRYFYTYDTILNREFIHTIGKNKQILKEFILCSCIIKRMQDKITTYP
jgi:hypothetical protein